MATSLPHFSSHDAILAAVRGTARKEDFVEAVGPWGSGKSLLAFQLARAQQASLLIVTASRIDAEAIYDDLCTFAGEEDTVLFPAWEVLPTDTMNPADDVVAERLNTLEQLAMSLKEGKAKYAVLPLRALLQHVVRRDDLLRDTLTLATGEEYELEDLLEKLIRLGYRREIMVEHRGDISVRGGILDIFPIASELPYRIEFFGDEIESIRRFEPETQRSIAKEERISVLPRSEKALIASESRENKTLASVLDYFSDSTLLVLDEPMQLEDAGAQLAAQTADSPFFLKWGEAQLRFKPFTKLSLAQVGYAAREGAKRFVLPMQSITGWAGQMGDFWEQLRQWDAEQYTVQLYCVNTGEQRRLHELLEEQGYRIGQDAFDLRVNIGRLRAGFTSRADKMAVLSEREMFGRHYMRRKRRRFEAGATITQFSDLKSGDYVVHSLHGIGRYVGLRRFEGKAGDFMALQYAGGDTMYVPVTAIDQIQKYTAGDGAMPKVDKLGGASWAKKRARVKKAVKDMTEELVKLYAARETRNGHAFASDTPWQREFEDAFEYDETPDQLRAIEDVKRDMESPRPMDRLLCGDVGFGKTEVALRAAFKAVMDGKQVAMLAPTTVLSQQHYTTFSERLADFPVKVEVLNRFHTAKEQQSTIDRLKSGEVDIVIGTHRITSKDVNFKDLGLVIVDEEQRFGVAQKERLKQIRTHVDVLTLSATPIPRTLHFSLIGVRDMSVINTAPNDRLPIHTCIEAWHEDTIKEAIERELAREGQVFFLHNRVQTIDKMAAHLNRLVPTARVATGHGQMERHQLEDVMLDFVNKKIDILVCTTIIGSGIDIPNANTIIVDRADTFGLGELYQIRGRVGRYKHRAFAYLLIPGDRALSEEAQERLKALEDFSTLGSGFRIAMRDLEIRGCGNILGAEQSGNIATVGYETYKELIEEAVAEQRGEPVKQRHLPPFEIAIDAYIPDEYVPTAQQKMTLYRRATNVHSFDEVEELALEIKDRFGQLPGPVRRLLDVMRARALAAEAGVSGLAVTGGTLRFSFASAQFLNNEVQKTLRQEFGDTVQFAWKDKPELLIKIDLADEAPKTAIALLKAVLEG
ncbi:MAG: transcription-repair coupling factor [Candidatus Hydrogenedentes bacterium]|nr:transcription-repair coupling factor [Candidatus Hydrogenedentota bacterium]